MSDAAVPDLGDLKFLELDRRVVDGVPVFFIPDEEPKGAPGR